MSYNAVEYQIVATLFCAGVLNKYNVLNFGSTTTFAVQPEYWYPLALQKDLLHRYYLKYCYFLLAQMHFFVQFSNFKINVCLYYCIPNT